MVVNRLHLFEFEDLPWFPALLRNAMTSYLSSTYRLAPFPAIWAKRMLPLLKSGEDRIVDLGSGSGGPIRLVLADLRSHGQDPQITLTDLYPKPANSDLKVHPQPVDARSVPASLRGIRTMFASFHHFAPTDARQILEDAFEKRTPICIFEGTSRSLPAIFAALLIPLFVLLLTPTVRPMKISQLLFTYLIPILPLLIFWDGLVSQFRTYSTQELRHMTADLQASDYTWEIGELHARGVPFAVPYLIGARRS
jgi:hypothetical protein